MIRVDAQPVHEVWPGYRARFLHTPHVSFVWWEIDAGATVPAHAHPHEQTVHMLDGEFELVVGGEARQLAAGDVVVIPGGVTHSARSLTPCRILDVFSPVREDYRQRFGALSPEPKRS